MLFTFADFFGIYRSLFRRPKAFGLRISSVSRESLFSISRAAWKPGALLTCNRTPESNLSDGESFAESHNCPSFLFGLEKITVLICRTCCPEYGSLRTVLSTNRFLRTYRIFLDHPNCRVHVGHKCAISIDPDCEYFWSLDHNSNLFAEILKSEV